MNNLIIPTQQQIDDSEFTFIVELNILIYSKELGEGVYSVFENLGESAGSDDDPIFECETWVELVDFLTNDEEVISMHEDNILMRDMIIQLHDITKGENKLYYLNQSLIERINKFVDSSNLEQYKII